MRLLPRPQRPCDLAWRAEVWQSASPIACALFPFTALHAFPLHLFTYASIAPATSATSANTPAIDATIRCRCRSSSK